MHMKGIHLLKRISKESSSFGHIALQKKRQENEGNEVNGNGRIRGYNKSREKKKVNGKRKGKGT